MLHRDPELLALLALGDDGASADQEEHLRGCDRCRRELDALRRVLTVGRTTGAPQALESPAPDVWFRIVDTLELPGYRPDELEPGPAVPLTPRRSRRRWVPVVAVAASLAVVAGVGAVLTRTAATPVATAALQPFPGWAGERGTATLQRRVGGEDVVLRTTLRPSSDTDYEVWLMTADAKRFMSLGVLRGERGTFQVPAGVDPGQYPQVDISDEPRDGDRAHSSVSILRGSLES